MKKMIVWIDFKDGSGQISEHKLECGLYFSKSEMIKWLKEKYKNTKPIKKITEISHE
jgi:predicted transcriptional regulator